MQLLPPSLNSLPKMGTATISLWLELTIPKWTIELDPGNCGICCHSPCCLATLPHVHDGRRTVGIQCGIAAYIHILHTVLTNLAVLGLASVQWLELALPLTPALPALSHCQWVCRSGSSGALGKCNFGSGFGSGRRGRRGGLLGLTSTAASLVLLTVASSGGTGGSAGSGGGSGAAAGAKVTNSLHTLCCDDSDVCPRRRLRSVARIFSLQKWPFSSKRRLGQFWT